MTQKETFTQSSFQIQRTKENLARVFREPGGNRGHSAPLGLTGENAPGTTGRLVKGASAMSGGHRWSYPSGFQGDVPNGTDQEHGPPQILETSTNWTWKSPTYFTNNSTILSGHASGLVPGLIAAGIFIMFLLCLYAILWKCMVSPPQKKRKKRGLASSHSQKPLAV